MKILLVFLLGTGGTAFGAELTFSQAVELMLQKNPGLTQRALEKEIAETQSRGARAAYFPQVDYTQNWIRSNNPVYVFGSLLNQRNFSQKNFAIDSLNEPDALTDVASQFQLGWLLYDFGGRENRIGSAESGYRIATLQENSLRLVLLRELVRRYYMVSFTREQLLVTREALEASESRLQKARDRVAQGLVVRSDELAAEVYRAQRAQENIEAENQLQFAVASLVELLGTESNVETSAMVEAHFSDAPLPDWESHMRQLRPELKMIAEASHIAKRDVIVKRSQFLPSIHLWSNYQWHGDSFSYSGNNWGAGLEVKWNLFRGFSDSAEYSVAKLREQAAIEKERETENQLLLQIKQAYFDFQSAKQKLQVASAALRQAAESKRIYTDRYESGMVTIHDSLQADTAYNQTKLMHLRELYNLYVSYASLAAAAGKEEEIKQMGGQP